MSEIIESTGREVAERTPEVIAVEIRTIEENIYKTAVTGAIEIGLRLQEIKDALPHGEWYNFISKNLGYSERQAQNFMKIASEYGAENSPYLEALSKTHTCADLSISKALRLLQVPENEVENFVEKHDVSQMKVKELEEEIKKLKYDIKEKEDAKSNTEKNLEDAVNIAKYEKAELQEEIERLKKELDLAAAVEVDDEFESYKKEMSEKIKKLESRIEKSKIKEKTLKEELNQANRATHEAVERAVGEAVAAATEEAVKSAEYEVAEKMAALEAEKKQKEEEITRLEKKLSASSDDTLIRLNIKVQSLQSELKDIKLLLSKLDPETATKIKKGLKMIIDNNKELME